MDPRALFDDDGDPSPGTTDVVAPPVVAGPSPRAAGAGRRRRRPRRTGPAQRWAVVAVAVAAGAWATTAPGAPTAWPVADAAWKALLAVVVTLAASRARRWAWLVTPGILAVAAGSGTWLAVGAVAVGLGVAAALLSRRRLVGAVIGALSVQVALHLPALGPFGGSSLVAVVGLLPVLVSGWRAATTPERTWVGRGLLGLAAVWVLGAVALFTAAMLAWSPATDAADAARGGLTAAEGGATGDAGDRLGAAAEGFAEAEGFLGALWMRPVLALPVLGQQADALATVAEQGGEVATAASTSAAAVDLDALRAEAGVVDVEVLGAAAAPLAATSAAVDGALAAVEDVRTPWLAGPLAEQVDEFAGEVADVAPPARVAAVAARDLPAVLGADGPRRYLVLFTTPAESRGAGGFVGSWAVLTAQDGRLELSEQGRADDVNSRPGRDDRAVTGPPEYLDRYGRFRPGYWFQDVTVSPDVPSSAAAAAEVFEQAGLGATDGVIVVDPYGLEALLELTGPVVVEGLDEPLAAEGAADWLLRGQYLAGYGDEDREDLLGSVAEATFDAVLDADLPGPARLADVLGPPAHAGRLAVVTSRPEEQELFDLLGVTGRFPEPAGGDLAALVTQNKGNNKIDVFLERSVGYEVTYDPASGHTEALAHVELTNTAPAAGLPEAFLGSNDQGLPPGTNRVFLTWYSPLALREARLDGARIPLERQRELGSVAYSAYVDLAPGQTRALDLVLAGDLAPGSTYRLRLPAQPLVADDELVVTVRPGPGWRPEDATAEPAPGGGIRLRPDASGDAEVEVVMDPVT